MKGDNVIKAAAIALQCIEANPGIIKQMFWSCFPAGENTVSQITSEAELLGSKISLTVSRAKGHSLPSVEDLKFLHAILQIPGLSPEMEIALPALVELHQEMILSNRRDQAVVIESLERLASPVLAIRLEGRRVEELCLTAIIAACNLPKDPERSTSAGYYIRFDPTFLNLFQA